MLVWIFNLLLLIIAAIEGYVIYALWRSYKQKAFKAELLAEIIEERFRENEERIQESTN